ncbi:MAG TPA: HlyD family efflux transporter periplasmic adaptor subunit [Planctomycetota bacterium]|nr:HlyD family efflux transporter periplasmic adaptor subunit [Planctomycetota bacterium]
MIRVDQGPLIGEKTAIPTRCPLGALGRWIFRAGLTLLVLWALPVAAADQPTTWKPHDHPATVERTITGFTRPRRALVIAAEVPGRITTVALDVGQRVTPEQTGAVVTIDDTLAVIARDQAQAALAAAEQAAASADLALKSAEAEAALRARTAARTKTLADQGKLSTEELDTSVTAASLAQLASERAKVAIAQAATAIVQAKLDLARTMDHLARHHVPAPAGWLVSMRQVEPGTMVAAGTPLLRVVDTTTLVVDLHLSADELAAIRTLPALRLVFPRHAGRSAAAAIGRLDPEFDPTTRKHRVELDLAGSDAPEAIGGLETMLTLTMPDPSGALLIPQRFLIGGLHVHLADGSEQTVTVVRREGESAVILPGALPTGATLVP